MQLTLPSGDFTDFLASTPIVDFASPAAQPVRALAANLLRRSPTQLQYIQNAYEYVRDRIAHSADIRGRVVTCAAPDVLRAGEGICFAKSHLLAALLRCRGVPAGFCYQRLILDDDTAPVLILHGLNAVYLSQESRWIRLDARGNKPGVNAQFSLTGEQLAFPVRPERGEEDIPVLYARPDANVVRALTESPSLAALWSHLPTALASR